MGGFVETKNQRFIVEVFHELYRYDNTYRLLLIGDGPLHQEVKETVKESGLQDVVCMTGNINNVHDYLNAMDLVLMPSLFEGLPLTLVEQQANGLRCVVSDAITTEADKTGNLMFLSLIKTASEWAKRIQDIDIETTKQRQARSQEAVACIRECGYSIQEEARKLK